MTENITEAKEALEQVRAAIGAAMAMLPKQVQHKHWVQQRVSPNPWLDVARWWAREHAAEKETATILAHIVWLAEEREKLNGFILNAEAETRPPDLSLPKVRRLS